MEEVARPTLPHGSGLAYDACCPRAVAGAEVHDVAAAVAKQAAAGPAMIQPPALPAGKPKAVNNNLLLTSFERVSKLSAPVPFVAKE